MDLLHRYLFTDASVRGELVQLRESLQQIVHSQEYPLVVQRLLAEMAAATCLLSATLKFEGDIGLQIQSEGPVRYAVINASHDHNLRGVARWDESQQHLPEELSALLPGAVLVITITPTEGERYQGIVALDKPRLAECLEAYFAQSEQLPTRVWLEVSTTHPFTAAGMLLQVLPTSAKATDIKQHEAFDHLQQLTQTITARELFELDAHSLLYRLYHQETVEIYPARQVQYACTCSKEKSAMALAHVQQAELLSIVEEEGCVRMNCQYCNAEYLFDAVDIQAIHAGQFTSISPPASPKH